MTDGKDALRALQAEIKKRADMKHQEGLRAQRLDPDIARIDFAMSLTLVEVWIAIGKALEG